MSDNLALEQMAEDQDGAEIVHNDSNAQLDAAITELLEVDVTVGNLSLSNDNYRQNCEFKVINEISPGISPNRSLTLPQIKRIVLIWCPDTNTDTVDIVRGAMSLAIAPGQSFFVRTDGTADGLYAFQIGGGSSGNFLDLDTTDAQTIHGQVIFDRLSSGDTITVTSTASNPINIQKPSGDTAQPLIESAGSTGWLARRYSTAAVFPFNALYRARGAIGAPEDCLTNDPQGQYITGSYLTGFRNLTGYTGVLIAAAPSSSDGQSRAVINVAPSGSITATEIFSADHTSGFRMSATVVIDANRIVRTRSTTIAGLITSTTAGKIAHVSDSNGGVGSFMMDTGGGYREVGSTGLKRLTTDAAATHTPLTDARHVRDLATLTADRNYTLAVTNVLNGYEVTVSRNGSAGGFNRNVRQADGTTLIKALADNTYGRFVWDSTAALWYLAETGSCA